MADAPVYLDNHATTRVDPRVLEALLPFFDREYGNAASVNHVFGAHAHDAVERAREQLAGLIGASPGNVIFTSGATEANNLALKGVLHAAGHQGHLVTAAAEHRSVLDPAKKLARQGFAVTIVGVDRFGMVDPAQIAAALRPETVLVSIMLANNEVGTINPLAEIAAVCRARGVLLHADCVQAAGRIPVDVDGLRVDLASFSAHKMYGPKGVGALYVRRDEKRIRIEPLLDGGGHEKRLRSGTLPVPLVVGFGAACAIAAERLDAESQSIGALRDRLFDGVRAQLDGVFLNGHPTARLPGNLNVSFADVDGEALMMSLARIAVSSGSACTSADPEPSHVLAAMGQSDMLTRASIRFGIGRFNTEADVEVAIAEVSAAVTRLRASRLQNSTRMRAP